MALTKEEFRKRVLAAAALHGTGMRGVRQILADFGTEQTLAEAVIRGDKDQNKRNVRDLAEALEVPREWFTEPDWRALLGGNSPPPERGLEQDLDDAVPRSGTTDGRSEGQGPASQSQ